MMMVRAGCLGIALAGLLALPTTGPAQEPSPRPSRLQLTVRAGGHDRSGTLLRFPVPTDRLGGEVVEALGRGPVGLAVYDPGVAQPTVAEVARHADGTVQATWFLPRALAAGQEARFEVDGSRVLAEVASPWAVGEPKPGVVEFKNRDRPVFRYNAAPVAPPGVDPPGQPDLIRSAYIHPAFSPAGALITGDFSRHHPHHRGFFLAYVHTRWGTAEPDFWNIQDGTGRVVADGFDPPGIGPVAVRFATRHRWEARSKAQAVTNPDLVALRERWVVEVYDVPGSPYWLFDLTSTQQAEGHPLAVLPYRYGGMAYRSAEPSVRGPLDVLTAEGRHRFDGDQKPTRWVDLTGPVADGSPNYAGALLVDHGANPRHPTVVRIHPITLPFASFVPAHDEPLTIEVGRPTTFRYRVMIHDGRPDPVLNNRIAWDFTDPPVIELD